MKQRYLVLVLVAVMAALCVPAGFAQATGSVKGVCKDTEGNPIVGATVVWFSAETGRKYEIKTNKKGEYFSLGIAPADYTVTLMKDGKDVFHFNGVHVPVDETVLDFDLKKEQSIAAQGQGISAEELKRRQEEAEKTAKETNSVKLLNDKLAESRDAMKTGNYDQAIALMTEATQLDASRDVLWATLADAYRVSAIKQTDAAEKNKRFESAVDAYQKALQAKQTEVQNGGKDPDANKKLAAYYNNLADAQGKAGKADDAIKSYGQAATLDPAGAGTYYFNLGAVLTNANKFAEADQAFDKAIAADPNKADAYYWKGVSLINQATLDKSTPPKMVVPPGTVESFQKYLDLQPTGQWAETAKQDIALVGGTVETSFGNKKKTTKK